MCPGHYYIFLKYKEFFYEFDKVIKKFSPNIKTKLIFLLNPFRAMMQQCELAYIHSQAMTQIIAGQDLKYFIIFLNNVKQSATILC